MSTLRYEAPPALPMSVVPPETSTIPTQEAVTAARLAWLAPIAWDFSVTLTHPRFTQHSTADYKVKAFLNDIEAKVRGRVACVYGTEYQSKDGTPVNVHHHLMMKSRRPLTTKMIEDSWRRLVKTAKNKHDDSVRVDRYDPLRPGLKYSMKMADDITRGELEYHNIGYFLPSAAKPIGEMNAAQRRYLKRWTVKTNVVVEMNDPLSYALANEDVRVTFG